MRGARIHVKSATGLACDGRECVTAAEVESAMYGAAQRRRRIAERQNDKRHVSAAAIEALIGIGSVVAGLMRDGPGGERITVEQAARRMEWDPAMARRGLAMLEADLSGFLCIIDRNDGGGIDYDWLDLEPAEIAAGVRDIEGRLKPEFVPVKRG